MRKTRKWYLGVVVGQHTTFDETLTKGPCRGGSTSPTNLERERLRTFVVFAPKETTV